MFDLVHKAMYFAIGSGCYSGALWPYDFMLSPSDLRVQ